MKSVAEDDILLDCVSSAVYWPDTDDHLGFPGSTKGIKGTKILKSTKGAGDMRAVSLIPGSGRSPPKKEMANPLQYSCLENSMDRGAWQATVHGVEKSWT